MGKGEGRLWSEEEVGGLRKELVHRHTQVFGDVKAEDANRVLKNWEALKVEEKSKRAEADGRKPETLLSGVSAEMPALLEANKISSKAAHVGFDWPDTTGIFEKLTEATH